MSQVTVSIACLRRIPVVGATGTSYTFNGAGTTTSVFARMYSSAFDSAVERLKHVSETDNQEKLKLYALYKQATIGQNTTSRPGLMELVKKAKWDAWNALGDMSKEEAQKEYIKFVDELLGASGAKGEEKEIDSADGLRITVKDGVRTIFLNRPDKFNALTNEMCDGIAQALDAANEDASTNIVVLASSGKMFCSGMDLANFTKLTDAKATAERAQTHTRLLRYFAAYINCRKPIVALVHGTAIGMAVKVLGLCDAVYASDSATFNTPFSALGQGPEGCSSYTFPRIIGYAKASEFLFFNTKITAGQAKDWGLVSEVIPQDRFEVEAWNKVNQIAKFPFKSIVYGKDLVRSRGRERALLHEVNKAECDRLLERWQSEDCMNAIMNFFSRKSK